MKIRTFLMYILCFIIIFANTNIVSAEQIVESYKGIDNAQEIINNVDFEDIKSKPKDYWAKDAIYKMAGLGIIKGYGAKEFKPNNFITKAETLALIYRSLGKESEAQIELEKFRQNTILEISNRDIPGIWAEGYLLLAKNDGLISELEFYQAVSPESYTPTDGYYFFPNDVVSREEVAVWIAKAFQIEPEYDQISIFNNYNDWEQTDYQKIPYVEAILREKIMNGDNGKFYPKNILKRAEITQLMSNIEDRIYEINNVKKKYGYVENILISDNKIVNSDEASKTILIRSNEGELSSIVLSTRNDNINSKSEELSNHQNISSENEVIVNKDGSLGKSQLLEKYDKVLIIYDENNNVKFIEAKSDPKYEERIYGTIDSVDLGNNKVGFTDQNYNSQTYVVSKGASISVEREGKGIEDINVGDKAYIIVKNNIITRIEVSKTIFNENPNPDEGKNDVKGVVQEINSNLNYISLYGSEGEKDAESIKTYNFNSDVDVKKDGEFASLQDIEVGNTVYLKFGDDDKIEFINVKSNYHQEYVEVFVISDEFIIVKYEDEALQQFNLDDDILIYKNGELVEKDIIHAGDKLKIVLNRNDSFAKIKEIYIEPDYHFITNIYKGNVYDIDQNEITLYNTKVLNKTKWNIQSQKGFVKIQLDDSIKLFAQDKEIGSDEAYSTYLNNIVYVATYSDYGQSEKALRVSCVDGYEKLYNDHIIYHYKSSKNLELENSFDEITYNDATIVTKKGRLTVASNIKNDDPVYIIGLRDAKTGEFVASVVQIEDKPSVLGIDIYRATISSIDEGKNFTVSSFSKLTGYEWNFVNTQKTFDINNDTIVSTTLGIVNNRNFADYGTTSYKDKIVYIAAKGTNALEISDAIFGVYNLRGEIYEVTGVDKTSGTTLGLQNVTILDNSTGIWTNLGEALISAYPNSLIIKNEKLVEIDDLEVGDKVRVIKKDNTETGDGFIILVED